jgi:hypothetical protein
MFLPRRTKDNLSNDMPHLAVPILARLERPRCCGPFKIILYLCGLGDGIAILLVGPGEVKQTVGSALGASMRAQPQKRGEADTIYL